MSKTFLGALGAFAMLAATSGVTLAAEEQPASPAELTLRIGDTTLMASDGHCSGKANFQGFSLSAVAASDAEAERIFAALSDGGQVRMPLTKTFFSSRFGMLADRFGVGWMMVVAPQ